MPLIAYRDLVSLNTTTLSSPQSWVTTLPLSNVKDSKLAKLARSSTTGFSLRCEFGSLRAIRFAALLGFNLASGHQVRCRLMAGTTVLATKLIDGFAGFVNPRVPLPRHYYAQFANVVECSAVEFDLIGAGTPLFDQPNGTTASTGAEVGRFWAGDAWVFDGVTTGIQTNWAPTVIDDGQTKISQGGQKYHERRRRRRRLDISFLNMSKLSLLGAAGEILGGGELYFQPHLAELLMAAGTTSDLIVLPRDTTLEKYKVGLYGSLADVSGPTHQKGDLYNCSFKVIESF
jgi:hypothetical protein